MKIQKINSVLQPRTSRPTEWKQPVVDAVTVGVGSAAGAFFGPMIGGGAGAATGAAAESMVTSEFSNPKSHLIARQAMVGLTAGLGASALELAGSFHPGLKIALGLALGGAAAALLPKRAESPLAGHWANLETTQAPELWKQGLTGEGVGVAVIDTGADNHQCLEGRIVAFRNFIDEDQKLHDAHIHGTQMSGIISGHGRDRKYPGVAPNSQLIVLQVADAAGKVNMDKVAEAIRWATENRAQYNIQVLNLSFAAEATDDPVKLAEINKAVEEATARGLIVVASAGNDGPEPAEMQAPASAPSALAVASQECFASNDARQHVISEFSHRSPAGGPGPTVAVPGSAWLELGKANSFQSGSGTSQAAAALSGVMALWKQARPDLTADQAREALQKTAVSLGEDAQTQGAGSARAKAGLDYLLANG